MGCGGSKPDDIKEDRKRIERKAQAGPTTAQPAQPRSPARGIAVPMGKSVDAGTGEKDVYGTSYTNKKTKEYDFLHNIVKQTRDNFIDVSQKASALDEMDASEREQKYEKKLSETAVPKTVTVTSLFALPSATATDAAAIAAILGAPAPSTEEIEFITSSAVTIATGLDNIDVKDPGKIVLSFDEL